MTEEQPKEVPQPETQTPAQDAQGGDKRKEAKVTKEDSDEADAVKKEDQEVKKKKNGSHAPTLVD